MTFNNMPAESEVSLNSWAGRISYTWSRRTSRPGAFSNSEGPPVRQPEATGPGRPSAAQSIFPCSPAAIVKARTRRRTCRATSRERTILKCARAYPSRRGVYLVAWPTFGIEPANEPAERVVAYSRPTANIRGCRPALERLRQLALASRPAGNQKRPRHASRHGAFRDPRRMSSFAAVALHE